jgi:hypothetical protein
LNKGIEVDRLFKEFSFSPGRWLKFTQKSPFYKQDILYLRKKSALRVIDLFETLTILLKLWVKRLVRNQTGTLEKPDFLKI